jgi:hypothetical protein
MNPSGVKIKPEPLPLPLKGKEFCRFLLTPTDTSMFTTEGLILSAVDTTACE